MNSGRPPIWEKNKQGPLVNTPPSLQAALNLLGRNPEIKIWAGATALPELMAEQVLSLTAVEELKKIVPWERYVDWGAGVTLSQMIINGKNYLPPLLWQALGSIGTYPLRNQATLGGNLCADPGGDLFPLLQILGAQAEIKTSKTINWLHNNQWGPRGLSPQKGEILTRIRIPKETWNLTIYEKLGSYQSRDTERLNYFCLLKTAGEIITALRMGIYIPSSGIIRSQTLEASLQGRKLPLKSHDRDLIQRTFLDEIPFLANPLTSFQKGLVQGVTDWMIKQLRED